MHGNALSRSLGWPLPCLLLLMVLAGCVGDAPAPAASPTPTGAASSGRSVYGNVVNEELQPVAGASVRETASGQSTQTDGAGGFRLENLTASQALLLEASHPGYRNETLRVDLQYVPTAEVRFVLTARPAQEPYHETVTTVGEVTCQVAFGSHHGFPGFYRRSCAEVVPESKERVQVPVKEGIMAGIIELSWTPQSQFADIMGLTLYLSTSKEEILLAAVHSLPKDHYVAVYTGTSPVAAARPAGGLFDTWVHVDPSALDEHVPTNVGVVVQQQFTLYTTAFYGAPPPPTWSAMKNG